MIEPLLDSLKLEDISDEEYFAKTGYISNSRLSLINPLQDGSEEKFLENKHISSSSLALGSAVHELILQPESFELASPCDKPTAKLGMMADFLYEIYKKDKSVSDTDVMLASDTIDYYKGKMDEKKINNVIDKCTSYWENRLKYESEEHLKEIIYLDNTSYDKCIACVKSINDNKAIKQLLNPNEGICFNETAIFMDFKYISDNGECIIKFKAKLDNAIINDDSIILNDLKTTGHYVDQFKDSFEKFHYYRQGACYAFLLKELAKKYYNIETVDSLTCNFLLVSTIPNHKSSVFKMKYQDLERGWNEFIILMNKVGDLYVRNNVL